MKSQLWDLGIDWMEVDDFELFVMLSQTLTPDRTQLLFGDLDFTKLKPYNHPHVEDEIILADKETGALIDKMIYLRIVSYLRKAFNITPKVEKAANKMTKKILIEEDRKKIELNKNKPFKSFLLPLISSVKVRQGYTKDYVLNMGYVEFMDDVARLQIINNADHLLHSAYSGCLDLKKIDKKELRDLINSVKSVLANGDSDDIKDCINMLYLMRKDSIATDGEHGVGNLLFKEIRNRGLLNALKDKYNEMISDELTLEHYLV